MWTLPEHAPPYTTTHKVAMLVIAMLASFLTSGVIFGDAALRQIFLAEGTYRHLCPTHNGTTDGPWPPTGHPPATAPATRTTRAPAPAPACEAQTLRLVLLFTVAASVTNMGTLLFGALLDAAGPRRTALTGAALVCLGAGAMAIADDTALDLFLPAYVLLALGGPCLFLTVPMARTRPPTVAHPALTPCPCP